MPADRPPRSLKLRRLAPNAVPHLVRLDASMGLGPSRPVRRVTLRVASTLYDGLRPVALFDVLGN
jgi:hypothetical protein